MHRLIAIIISAIIVNVCAAKSFLTTAQTKDTIQHILTSNYRYYAINHFSGGGFSKETSCDDSRYTYYQYFRDDSSIVERGLRDDNGAAGTWWYFDSNGKKYKEYNFTTHKRTLFGMTREPYEELIDSVQRLSMKAMVNYLGASYTASHVRISRTDVEWYVHEMRMGRTYSSYPHMPWTTPYAFHVSANIIYHDTIIVGSLNLRFDSTLQLLTIGWDEPERIRRAEFKFDYDSASAYAIKNGYTQPLLEWNKEFHDFYWVFENCKRSDIPYERPDCDVRKICARTGEGIPYMIAETRTCPTSTEFVARCPDTCRIPAGHKRIFFGGVIFTVPLDWFVTSVDGGAYYYQYLTNGKDTIHSKHFCGREAMYHYRIGTAFDSAAQNSMYEKFPDHHIQHRSYSFTVGEGETGSGRYELGFQLLEDISALSCGTITYKFYSDNLSQAQVMILTDILLTARFSRCIPWEGQK